MFLVCTPKDNQQARPGGHEGRKETTMNKVKVKFYTTEHGVDRLKLTLFFDTIEEAQEAVEKWEAKSPDNYAVYGN